jgi:hypothetical protein
MMMRSASAFACGLAVALLVVLPSAASARASHCHGNATISAVAGITDHNFIGQPGPTGTLASPLASPTLRFGHVYQLGNTRATVTFGDVRFLATAETVLSLGCFGQVVGGPLLPSLRLESGSVTVLGSVDHPGGVDTVEALANPVLGYPRPLRFTVTRKLTVAGPPSEEGMFLDAGHFIEAPLGTTTVVTDGAGYTNITPYVGESPGSCRHAERAQLRTTGRRNRNFAGTAKYLGLH